MIFVERSSCCQITNDMLALGFIIDAFVAMDLLAWRFTRNPLGRFTRRSFTVSNLLGGLGFSLPFFYYLNKRS